MVKVPLYTLHDLGSRIQIRGPYPGGITFSYPNTEKGHKKAAAKMKEIEAFQHSLDQLLIFWCPQHVKERVKNG